MTAHWTPTAHDWLVGYLATHYLQKGLGDKESACSIAAINLALTGKLTDDVPDCMSEVIGWATISLQDSMPDEMRNSDRYKSWLPTAAGTGRDHETERLAVLMDWMWGTVLPQLQDLADDTGVGPEWRKMCEERTESAAYGAAHGAAHSSVGAAAAFAATNAALADPRLNFWRAVDPIGVLERMTNIGED